MPRRGTTARRGRRERALERLDAQTYESVSAPDPRYPWATVAPRTEWEARRAAERSALAKALGR